jgi:hypothetical protein
VTRKKRSAIIVLVCLGLIAIPLAWCVGGWLSWGSPVEWGPMSVGQARAKLAASLPEFPALPDEARNVRYAGWGAGVGYEDCLRFEAPPEVCKAYAERFTRDWVDEDEWPCTLKELRDRPQPVRLSELRIGWFDIHQITRGFATVDSYPMRREVWVDMDRGVFYWKDSD